MEINFINFARKCLFVHNKIVKAIFLFTIVLVMVTILIGYNIVPCNEQIRAFIMEGYPEENFLNPLIKDTLQVILIILANKILNLITYKRFEYIETHIDE